MTNLAVAAHWVAAVAGPPAGGWQGGPLLPAAAAPRTASRPARTQTSKFRFDDVLGFLDRLRPWCGVPEIPAVDVLPRWQYDRNFSKFTKNARALN